MENPDRKISLIEFDLSTSPNIYRENIYQIKKVS